MTKTDNNKIIITAMILVGVLILKCVVSESTMEYNTMEHMDPSTAEWIEQPTDIVMPSINEESLKNKEYPNYHPNVQVNQRANEQQNVNNNVAKSHLIFKDGNVPRDYVTDENMNRPEEVLDSAELLPDDENNTWTDVNPQGTGSIAYKNFLDVGHHVGQINVLRNADLSLRSTPTNPQFNVGPWRQTTILPNVHVGQDADVCV
jgi:hypothetical protein